MLCSRVQNLLSAYCDRELSGAEMLQIRRHLGHCSACRREYEEIQVVKRLLSALPSVEPEEGFPAALLDSHPRLQPAWERLRAACADRLGILARRPSMHFPVLARNLPFAAGSALALSAVTIAMLAQPQPSDAIRARVPERVQVEDRVLFSLEERPPALVIHPGHVIHSAGMHHAVLPEPGASEPIFVEGPNQEVAYPVYPSYSAYQGGGTQSMASPAFARPYGHFRSNAIVPVGVVESVGYRR